MYQRNLRLRGRDILWRVLPRPVIVERRTSPARGLAVVGALVIVGAALLQRALVAFSTGHVLDWDETYYASIAATALAGYGLYPFVQGYPEMSAMGGIGHALWAYVAAFDLFGPDIRSLRGVTFAAAVGGLLGVFVLCRHWYGTLVAALTAAAVSSSTLFRMTLTARPDALVFAWGTWTLVLVAAAFDKPRAGRWHAATGLVAALGLQVHLHSVAVAAAIGLLYLVDAVRAAPGTPLGRRPIVPWLAGYGCGALIFLAANVLPDPDAFLRTAGLTRLAMLDDVSYSAEEVAGGGLLATFFAPGAVIAKEAARYALLYRTVSPLEALGWALALVALYLPGATDAGRRARVLVPGVLVGAAVVLNGTSPIYATHLLPVLVLPVAGLFARLVSVAPGRVAVVGLVPVLVLVGLAAREAIQWPRTMAAVERFERDAIAGDGDDTRALVSRVRDRASVGCHLAGDTSLYVPYFTDYPAFTGTRETEVRIGSSYARLRDDRVAYWRLKAPDVVFGDLDADLARFVESGGYDAVGDRVWIHTARRSAACEIRVP